MKRKYFAPWEPGCTYHVYNRAVALNRLFVLNADVDKFWRTLRKRLHPFFATYALVCVGNHFHLHGRLRTLAEIHSYLESLASPLSRQRRYMLGEVGFQELIGDAFARTFHSYARSFNLRHNRTGSLLDQTVRRIMVRDGLVSRRLIAYIHFNHFKHGLTSSHLGLGKCSSFETILGGRNCLIDVDTVLARFGGHDAFIKYHEMYAVQRRSSMLNFDEEKYFGYEAYPQRFAYELNRGELYRG